MNKIFFYVALFLLVFSNCKKNQPPIYEPVDPVDTIKVPIDTPPVSTHIIDLGKGFALNNGVDWSPTFEATFHYKTTARFYFGAKSCSFLLIIRFIYDTGYTV
jgi:hypothetical protein